VPAGTFGQPSDEVTRFAKMLRTRHDLASGLRLKSALQAIEQHVSDTSALVRIESKGVIRGRLDIPQYLFRRAVSRSWPRTYPIFVSAESPNTPENILVREVLRRLSRNLASAEFPCRTAERRYCLWLYRWINDRTRRPPWVEVMPRPAIERLRRETQHRIRKRQTGNEPGYEQFLRWLDEWQLDPARLNDSQIEQLAVGILAFPVEPFFWDKVFEVWCLKQVAESLMRCGAKLSAGPRPLIIRGAAPIYDFEYHHRSIKVWFQRALPADKSAWRYEHSGEPLRAIPDISVIDSSASFLLVDAKNRFAVTDTRGEEAYKILGYLENYRPYLANTTFHAVLCFVADHDLYTPLCGPKGNLLTLVGAHSRDPGLCKLASHLDTAVERWLEGPTALAKRRFKAKNP
jgi:hypothetical protein